MGRPSSWPHCTGQGHFQSTIKYREVNQELADCTMNTLARHKLYLTTQVILLSDNVTKDEKSRIAARMLSREKSLCR